MPTEPHDRHRLYQLDRDLRAEADRVLEGSGLGQIIRDEGFAPQGSYIMGTMTWRDVDFEREQDAPDWDRHWDLGRRLAATAWPWRASCINADRDDQIPEQGLYWGLRVSDPALGNAAPVWKIDLWTARPGNFARQRPHRQRWQKLLNDENRYQILRIKEAVCGRGEYRKTMLSVHIYEAVLDCGIRDLDEFLRWWQNRCKLSS